MTQALSTRAATPSCAVKRHTADERIRASCIALTASRTVALRSRVIAGCKVGNSCLPFRAREGPVVTPCDHLPGELLFCTISVDDRL